MKTITLALLFPHLLYSRTKVVVLYINPIATRYSGAAACKPGFNTQWKQWLDTLWRVIEGYGDSTDNFSIIENAHSASSHDDLEVGGFPPITLVIEMTQQA